MNDILEELEKVMILRPGNGGCDVNVYAIEYPVTYGLLDRLKREIVNLRITAKWVNAGLPIYSYDPATDSMRRDQGLAGTFNTTSPNAGRWQQVFGSPPVSATMIYTGMQQKALATQAVEKAVDLAAQEGKEPPTEDEKDRLWNLIKAAVEGS
jgi:hypothetical protein